MAMTKSENKTKKRPPQSWFNRRVDQYLKIAGIHPPLDLDDFAWRFCTLHGALGERFFRLVHKRGQLEPSSPAMVRCLAEQYRLKNSSLRFSQQVSSQFSGRNLATFLKYLSDVRFETPPQRVLDIGCDNGILTGYYAIHFPHATVVGVDRCREAIACATDFRDQLEFSNLSFVHGNPLQARQPKALGKEKWDLVVMSLCGYEESTRQPEAELALAQRFMNLLAPDGTGIVVEPSPDGVLKRLVSLANSSEVRELPFQTIEGTKSKVHCAVLRNSVNA